MPVQVFGRRDSREAAKAVRFFKERRVPVSYVDLAQRPIAPAELRRFAERFGAAQLIDQKSRAYAEAGLAYLSLDPDQIMARLLADQRLLRLPLVRNGQELAVGVDEVAWRSLLSER